MSKAQSVPAEPRLDESVIPAPAGISRRPARRPSGGRSRLAPGRGEVVGTGTCPNSQILGDPAVKVGAAVAEEAEGGAVFLRRREVEDGVDDPGFDGAEFGEDVAAFVADEGVAVE